ncbi:MAG: DNA polymerase IV [Candidatus Heimdallarchaeota archaeon]|nr:DNA polymerase IV [Candidatus Heimdallarchaeota archaeon]
MMNWSQVIFHIDLDSFFASVHIKYNPFLQDLPVIIGADPRNGNGRGVVSTCSYVARKYGIHSAMPISQAFRLCPEGIYVCSGKQISFPTYNEESIKVMEILESYADKFQQAGIDEAYLDVSESWNRYGSSPMALAKIIQDRIFHKLSLSVSIGISETKSIAKIASDLEKPKGITSVHNSELEEKIYHLSVRKIVGVGKKTEKSLQKLGIINIGQIASLSRIKIYSLLGDYGLYLQKVVKGLNVREVGYSSSERKSIGSERTFGKDQSNWQLIEQRVNETIHRLIENLHKKELLCRTITIKIRFEGFDTYTRSHTYRNYINNENVIRNTAMLLLQEYVHSSKKVRLIGVRFSNLKSCEKQMILTSFIN